MAFQGRSLAILVVIASAVAFIALSAGVDAQIPAIVIDLEDADKEQTAFPSETQNDILEFDGCLTFNRPFWLPGSSVVIELVIEMPDLDTPWVFSLDPPTHTFGASETQTFLAQVTVPADLPATVTIGNALLFTVLTVDTVPIYDETTDTARVNIAQYYRIGKQYSTKPINIKQGEIHTFNFTVQNTGNGVDTFSFEVANEAELLFAGLTPGPITSERIEVDEEANVRIQVSSAADAVEGQFHFNLTITSDGSASDPNSEAVVKSSIEWNIVIEPSTVTTIIEYLPFIIPGIIILVVVVVVVVLLKRRKKAKAEAEAMAEEEAPRPKKKRKKRPPKKVEDDAEEDE
jgi:hypothetical protein